MDAASLNTGLIFRTVVYFAFLLLREHSDQSGLGREHAESLLAELSPQASLSDLQELFKECNNKKLGCL